MIINSFFCFIKYAWSLVPKVKITVSALKINPKYIEFQKLYIKLEILVKVQAVINYNLEFLESFKNHLININKAINYGKNIKILITGKNQSI